MSHTPWETIESDVPVLGSGGAGPCATLHTSPPPFGNAANPAFLPLSTEWRGGWGVRQVEFAETLVMEHSAKDQSPESGRA